MLVTDLCDVFNDRKQIYSRTLLLNQQLFRMILETKARMTLNKPVTCVILFVIPPVVSHSTQNQSKEKQKNKNIYLRTFPRVKSYSVHSQQFL